MFAEAVRAKPGWQSEPHVVDADGNVCISDALRPSGRQVELKPYTPSGRKAGRRQRRRYEEVKGKKGRVVYYDAEQSGQRVNDVWTRSVSKGGLVQEAADNLESSD